MVGGIRYSSASLAGAVEVLNGGTLGDLGTVGVVTVEAGGTLAPGNSIGSNIEASLMMKTGATFEVESNDGGFTKGVNNDHMQVMGTATFADGAIIAIKSHPAGDDGSSYASGRYTILNAVTPDIQGDLIFDEKLRLP